MIALRGPAHLPKLASKIHALSKAAKERQHVAFLKKGTSQKSALLADLMIRERKDIWIKLARLKFKMLVQIKSIPETRLLLPGRKLIFCPIQINIRFILAISKAKMFLEQPQAKLLHHFINTQMSHKLLKISWLQAVWTWRRQLHDSSAELRLSMYLHLALFFLKTSKDGSELYAKTFAL